MSLFSRRLIFALTVSSVVSLGAWFNYGWTAPTIVLAATEQQAGSTFRGETIHTAIAFTSVGFRRPVVAVSAKSCGCTAAIVEDNSSGKAGRLAVTIGTGGLSDGNHTRSITLATNDPQHRTIRVSVSFSVVAEFPTTARLVDFGDVRAGTEAHTTVTVTKGGGTKALITGVEFLGSSALIGAPVKATDGNSVVVGLAVDRNAGPGVYFGTAVVHTTSQISSDVRIPVRVRIV